MATATPPKPTPALLPMIGPESLSDAEAEMCRRSKLWLFERHFVILDKAGDIRLMRPLKLAQQKLLAVLEMCRRMNIPAWIIVGKSRKEGVSTGVAADALTEYERRGIDVLVLAHDRDSTAKLLGIYQRFHKYWDTSLDKSIPAITKTPLWKGTTNKYELKLEGKEGLIEIATANNENAGRSRTPHYVHWSEVAFSERGATTVTSLANAVGRKPGTTFILESTFNGEDALFYPTWQGANGNAKVLFETVDGKLKAELQILNQDAWNGWIPLFISVLEDEDAYEVFRHDDERERFAGTLDAYEKMLVDRMNASLEYLHWRRLHIKVACNNDVMKYKQEFPATSQEAVEVSSKRAKFDHEALSVPPVNMVETGECGDFYQSDSWDRKITWRRNPTGDCIRYRAVVPNHRYVCSVDVAEGKLDDFGKEQDSSVVHVWDLDMGMEQVCVLSSPLLGEEALVAPTHLIAEDYNFAFLIIESNSTGKHTCIEIAKVYPRDRLYHRDDWDPTKSRQSREIGFRTHVGNKNVWVGALAEVIGEKQMVIHCQQTIDELKYYEKKAGGGTEARAGRHDDHVTSCGLGVIGAKSYRESKRKETEFMSSWTAQATNQRRKTANSITGY